MHQPLLLDFVTNSEKKKKKKDIFRENVDGKVRVQS